MISRAQTHDDYLACLCEYKGDMKPLLEHLKAYRKGMIMQVFKDGSGTADALLPAYINAKLRASEGAARAKDINVDFMLLVARTMKIEKAIGSFGANAPRFVFFSEDRGAGKKFLREQGIKIIRELKLRIDMQTAEDVALSELLEK